MTVAVIGGGPAGMMAAIRAAEGGAKVTLFEKNNRLGRKLAITGKGRCNLTNIADVAEVVKNIPGNGKFLYSALRNFTTADTIKFFENLELLGNKSLLEKRINIRAADYRFADKKIFYLGDKNRQGTEILELRRLAESKNNFTEYDILERNEKIFNHFIARLEDKNLFK